MTSPAASGASEAAGTRRPVRRFKSTDIALIAVFAALIAAFAMTPPIPVGNVGVPITLQTLVIGLTGLTLGPLRGFLATLLYLVLGLIGLPIFAGFSGGLGVLAGPTAGYLIAFPLFALLAGVVAGWAVKRMTGGKLWATLFIGGLIASFLTTHPLGILGISFNAGIPLSAAFVADLPYWPGDVVKNIVAASLALLIHRAFPAILVRR
ncbi:biotin transporter BioY [Brevibacterium luteolum]|uniref:biotin transporter BioY n=1 Tax=Brevibacterium luteolum TaxID=199591 RepID=UPI00387A451E